MMVEGESRKAFFIVSCLQKEKSRIENEKIKRKGKEKSKVICKLPGHETEMSNSLGLHALKDPDEARECIVKT